MTSPDARRTRQVALLVLGVAAVLLVSTVTWFGSGRPGVGVGQLVVGVVVAGVGAVLMRRSRRAG
jgi:hypothetical protein